MKKLIIILAILLMGIVKITCVAKVVRNGNTFETVQSSQPDVKTYLNWKDKDGIVYPIYITKKGTCYVKRISKKTNKEYKYYLPKEIQEQIKKELNIQ